MKLTTAQKKKKKTKRRFHSFNPYCFLFLPSREDVVYAGFMTDIRIFNLRITFRTKETNLFFELLKNKYPEHIFY